jgi:hypothetical protein
MFTDNSSHIISFAIQTGCKNLLWVGNNKYEHIYDKNKLEKLFDIYGIRLYSFGNNNVCSEHINMNELENIANFRNLICVYHTEENYTISGLIRYLIKIFKTYHTTNLFFKYGLRVINSNNKMSKHNLDFNLEDKTIMTQFLNKYLRDDDILFGIHPFGLHTIYDYNVNVNIKRIVWQDDLHYFAHFLKDVKENKLSILNYTQKYVPLLISDDKINKIITPSSIYFKNLNIINCDHKIVNLFYSLDPNHYNNIKINNYDDRKNQIILSGVVGGGYHSRINFLKLKKISKQFDELIFHQQTPGYTNNAHMTEMNYYNKLAEYKGAFVGHHTFPLNFLLAKHIEILMCGCLGFYEMNPLLLSELGLIEFEHYIPCTDSNGNLIMDHNFYTNWLNSDKGREIALNGAKYVREQFGEKYLLKYIDAFKN